MLRPERFSIKAELFLLKKIILGFVIKIKCLGEMVVFLSLGCV